ncbi:Rap/ran-GAP family protein [Trichomonas vaginalis G3]|uniref:Rap/ran-GAP family protein n=1 Tax=Trichomonas vaginalis (strain ATCC PRA-98 / G3) TaxID=412133 RepID=A2FC18_TRIV3|nr:GTPase activator protein [Trichomonas vaginalis G3]EAX97564.1 Rap/ran-GAP family protein [Trichomonas vaginalis G3]KAI5488106.1 GTPase activator protein [Trichomonas vaginalis G3]|eukprot:XP_001310494.1 Rap/ran-GAP family protein [Trichomonas vaginalis G3]
MTSTPVDIRLLKAEIENCVANKKISELINNVVILLEQDSTYEGEQKDFAFVYESLTVIMDYFEENPDANLYDKFYQLFFTIIRKSEKIKGIPNPFLFCFSKIVEREDSLQKFAKEFEGDVFPIDFIWLLLRKINPKNLHDWFKVLSVHFDRYPALIENTELVAFYLEHDSNDKLKEIYKVILAPLILVNINPSQSKEGPFSYVFEKKVSELIQMLKQPINESYLKKFIPTVIINSLYGKNPSMEEIYSTADIISQLITPQNQDTICSLINYCPHELVKDQVLTYISFNTKNTKILEKVSHKYLCRFFAQVGIKFIGKFLNLSDDYISKIVETASVSENRNKRMKYTDFSSLFRSKVDILFTDPVAFDCFLNDQTDDNFCKFHPSSCDLQTAEAYINGIIELFPETSVLSYFLKTLAKTQYYLKQSFEFPDNYIWNNFFEKAFSMALSDISSTTLEVIRIIVLCSTITETKKEQLKRYINFLSGALLSNDDQNLISEALKAVQHAFSHIVPDSFSLIPSVVIALQHQKLNKISISQILSIITILVSCPDKCNNMDVSSTEEFSKVCDIKSNNYFMEYESLIQADDLHERIITILLELINQYCHENNVDNVTLGILYSLIWTFSDHMNDNIKEMIMNIARSIFDRDVTVLNHTIRQIGYFQDDYEEISKVFPELYDLILEYLTKAVLSPDLGEQISTFYLEIFSDICLSTGKTSHLTKIFDAFRNSHNHCPTIDLVHDRFLMRTNQAMSPVNLPQNRDSYMSNNCTLGCATAQMEATEITFATLAGCYNYHITPIRDVTSFINVDENTQFPEIEKSNETEFDKKFEKLLSCAPKGKTISPSQLMGNFPIEEKPSEAPLPPPSPNSSQERFSFDSQDANENEFMKSMAANAIHTTLRGEIKHVKIIPNTQILDLSAKTLFSLPLRECCKIGIIFVRDGQNDQNEILANSWDSTAGSHFRSFILSIGRIVDIGTHKFYCGKLDTLNFSNGRYHVYFDSERYEVMFHTAPLLPNDEGDKQQIYKKRHIGNDNVHIVWSHHSQDYNMQTITSQFNDALVIVYPVLGDDKIFRVSVLQKDETQMFGPLHDETIICAKALPRLVRWTAIFADRVARMMTDVKLPCELFMEGLKTFTGV